MLSMGVQPCFEESDPTLEQSKDPFQKYYFSAYFDWAKDLLASHEYFLLYNRHTEVR
jgi:hypothetical protein